MSAITILLGLLFILYAGYIVDINAEAFKDKLETVSKMAENALQQLYTRWDISHYPNFLRSASMTHTSWEVLKLKMQSKILAAANSNGSKFVISFMGSSVTAGHDSLFNQSFPVVTKNIMGPVFAAVGIDLVTLNSAIGNNPCLPYDACVRTFSGPDADIVHWEQSYNCFGSDAAAHVAFEQFIRQSLALSSQPVVVFSASDTPNWKEDKCTDTKPVPITDEEKKMLEALNKDDALSIVSVFNNKAESVGGHWTAMTELFKAYKTAGIQLWNHGHYEKYKCHGPYVKDWGCCSASWHPSLLGHELRGAHYSFFWLLAFKAAVKELMATTDISLISSKIAKHSSNEHKHLPQAALYPSLYPDHVQCYTTYEPRGDQSLHLLNLVIPPADTSTAWKVDIMELLMDKMPAIIERSRQRGYLDYKYMIYGNKDSSPLNLKIEVKEAGIGFLCGPPGVWGKLPDGHKQLWQVDTKVYVTENVNDATGFQFAAEKAKAMTFVNDKPKDTQSICAHFTTKFAAGNHVLTIVPSTSEYVSLSYLLLP